MLAFARCEELSPVDAVTVLGLEPEKLRQVAAVQGGLIAAQSCSIAERGERSVWVRRSAQGTEEAWSSMLAFTRCEELSPVDAVTVLRLEPEKLRQVAAVQGGLIAVQDCSIAERGGAGGVLTVVAYCGFDFRKTSNACSFFDTTAPRIYEDCY